MKSKIFFICSLILTSITITACDPGTVEYGYTYNPKGVLYKMFQDLKNDEYNDDWIILFSGKMVCYYNSDQVIAKLKKTIGNMETALDRFTLEQPVLVQTGTNIKGYQDAIGRIEKGERYKARVIRNSDRKTVFTAMISCFKEYSGGSSHQYCMITDLENHVLGNPKVPVCEDLP